MKYGGNYGGAQEEGKGSGPAGLAAFFAPLLETEEFAEGAAGYVLEVRRLLEAQAAWLAALHGSTDQLRSLEQDVRNMEIALDQGRPVDEVDAAFHLHVAEASGNPLLARIMNGIFAVLDQAVEPGRREMVRDHPKQRAFVEQHREILQGIREGDPERARQAMYVHLSLVEREAGGS
ncbi:MAG: hypothetical protein Kow00129_03690 [Thermoleophilia bacterium]